MIKIIIPGNPKPKNEKIRIGKYGQFYPPTGKMEQAAAWDIYCQYRDQCRKQKIKIRDPKNPLIIYVVYFYREKRRDQYPDETNLNSFLADIIEKSGLVYNDKILKIIVDEYWHNKEIEGRTEIIIDESN